MNTNTANITGEATGALTVETVTQWVSTVDDQTFNTVLVALQDRQVALRVSRSEQVQECDQVVIRDTSPRFLEGLEGVVDWVQDGKVDVLLSAESTGRLRFSGQDHYDVGSEMRFLIEGVPACCCFQADTTYQAVAMSV